MKFYLNAVALFAFIVATIGFIVPAAVSAKDTIAVVAGLGWLAMSPAVVWYWLRALFRKKADPKEA